MAEKFSVQAVFTAVDQFSGPVARMSDALNKFNGKGGIAGTKKDWTSGAIKDAHAAMGRIGDTARNVRNMVVGVGVAGGFMAHRLITSGASIESALLTGASKFGDGIRRNTPAFDELKTAVFELGKTTKFGAVEAAGALNELAASGFDPASAIKNLPIMAQMAIAGSEDLQTASNIALDSLGAFGMLYNEMGQLRGPEQLATNLTRVADVIAYTANQTTASMGSFYETLTEAGPITKVAGMTFEKFAAITGALSQAGIKGSQAGTAIKNISVRLLSPTTEGTKELRKLKIDEKSFRKMSDPLQQLDVIARAIDKLPKEDKVKALDEYFGKISLPAASFLANGGFRNASVLENKILQNAAGSNARQADIISDSTDGKLKKLENTFERIGQTVFEKIQTPLEETIDKAIKYLDNNEGKIAKTASEGVSWLGENMDTVGTGVKWGAFAIAGGAIAGIANSVFSLVGNLWSLGKGAAAVALRMGGATLAVGKFFETVSMGRIAFSAATGVMTGGLTILTEAAALIGKYYNNDTKIMTGGLGTWDLISGAFRNTWNGDPRGIMGVINDHQDHIAKRDKQQRLFRELSDAPDTAFDAALKNSQYGDLSNPNPNEATMATLMSEFSQSLRLEPIVVPKEAIQKVDVREAVYSVFDAIAAQISVSGPGVVGTEDKAAAANDDFFGLRNQTNVDVTVSAEKGTKARATTEHTRPNNHRTGTN